MPADNCQHHPRMNNTFEFNEIYQPVFTTKARYIDIWGGRAGGRSFFGTEYFLFLITQPMYFRGCFLRNVAADIRESLWQDFKDRVDESNFNEDLFEFNESKMSVRYRPTGNTIISKGFRKSSSARTGKLKSLAGLTHVLIEEADENSESDVNKLDDSIRTDKIDNIQILLLHNAPHKNHWIVKRFYNLTTPCHLDGSPILDEQTGKPILYYKAVPKTNPDVLVIFTDYTHNITNLNKKTIHKYREYGRRESPFYNEEYYYVDVLGLIPEGARGRIYKGWYHITKQFYDSLPYPEYLGIDFGYSDDPVAVIGIKTHNNRNFYHEYIYEKELTNPALASLMRTRGIPYGIEGFADSAEPKSIQELNDLGFKRIKAAEKGPDSVLFGIKVIKAMENYATESSKNIWMENEEYKWKLDSEGEPTDEPVDANNHAKDGIRYGVTTKKAKKRRSQHTTSSATVESSVFKGGKEIESESPLDWI